MLPRPTDWREGLEVVGYWWPYCPPHWQPPAELLDFLETGPPPVFVGFGSIASGQGARLSELVLTALRRAGVRGVIQAGWAELDVAGDDVLTIGDVPHEWLFPRTAAVVHHAGAGTTAAALRAGVPSVAVPLYADQPLWASRIAALGAGPPPVRFQDLSAERLAAAVRQAVSTPAYRIRVEELSRSLAAEDGAAHVVHAVERCVG